MALLAPDGAVAHIWGFRPEDDRAELVAAVQSAVSALKMFDSRACFFETTGYMPGDGGKGSFTFGRVNGLLEGALRALGVPPIFVPPMIWQAKMECLTGGDKNVSKRRAIELFPQWKITHGIADALLIAEYGRRWLSRRGLLHLRSGRPPRARRRRAGNARTPRISKRSKSVTPPRRPTN